MSNTELYNTRDKIGAKTTNKNFNLNTELDLEKMKQAMNYGDGTISNAVSAGITAGTEIPGGELKAYLSKQMGPKGDTTYGVSANTKLGPLELAAAYDKLNADNWSEDTVSAEAKLKLLEKLSLAGRYSKAENPYYEEVDKNVSLEYTPTEKDVIKLYRNKNNQMGDADGISYQRKFDNGGTLEAGYNDRDGLGAYFAKYGINF